MKNVLKNYVVALIMLVLFITSCGESVDPTKADLKIVMKATTDFASINPGGRVAESGIEFTEARIGVTEIEFESVESYDDDSHHSGGDDDSDLSSRDDGNHTSDEFEIEYQGQFTVDLLAGTSNPDFGIADLFPGTYKEIEVKMRPIMNDGKSLFIAFNYQPDGGDPMSVEISTSREFEFEIEKHAGIVLDGNTINQILILFDLDKVLAGVNFSMANVDSDGVLRINDSSNTAFANAILANFHNSCEAGEDDNGDDRFDDDSYDDHSDDD